MKASTQTQQLVEVLLTKQTASERNKPGRRGQAARWEQNMVLLVQQVQFYQNLKLVSCGGCFKAGWLIRE